MKHSEKGRMWSMPQAETGSGKKNAWKGVQVVRSIFAFEEKRKTWAGEATG